MPSTAHSTVVFCTVAQGFMAFAALLALLGCSPPPEPKKIEMEPIGTVKNVPTTARDEPGDGGLVAPNSGTTPQLAGAGASGSGSSSGASGGNSACNSTGFDNLEEVLKQCEVPMPRASEVPSIKDKLDVKVTTSTASTTPGGRIDVQITLRNKTSEALALYFTGDPAPRFDLETVDAKGRRVDLPTAKWPGYPKGYKPEARDAKAARVTLDKNGFAKIKVTWDAVKTKWAPEKARGWDGRGYPRTPSGPLAPGKYSLRVVLPLIGEVDAPKVPIDVGSS